MAYTSGSAVAHISTSNWGTSNWFQPLADSYYKSTTISDGGLSQMSHRFDFTVKSFVLVNIDTGVVWGLYDDLAEARKEGLKIVTRDKAEVVIFKACWTASPKPVEVNEESL